jgi:hypothetical protein
METNLDVIFKKDRTLETAGVEFVVTNEISFFMKRMGGANGPSVKKAMAKHYAPYSYQIQKGILPEDKEKEVLISVFVDACLIDWKGVKASNGDAIAFSKSNAIEILKSNHDLFEALYDYSQRDESFKESVGN